MPTYIRLTDYKSSEEKERGFFDPVNRYEAKQEDFEKIPGNPIAYWVSDKIKNIFYKSVKLGEMSEPRQGMATTDNERFLRFWYEISSGDIKFNCKNSNDAYSYKWFPYNKGGAVRKWYGNNEYIVNYERGGEILIDLVKKKYPRITDPEFVIKNRNLYFKEGITWSALTNSFFSSRYCEYGYIFDTKGSMLFVKKGDMNIFLSLMNGKIFSKLFNIISPTLDFNPGPMKKLPIIFPKSNFVQDDIKSIAQQNIDISKEEWDSRETSWDFRTNELVRMKNEKSKMKSCRIEDAYNAYCDYWREKFFQLHANEEELNRLFIDIYGLQDELTPDVPLEDITILKNEAKIVDKVNGEAKEGLGELVFQADEIMKQFISYAVGVMFGRYSLDHEGLHIADMGVSLQDAASKFGIEHPTFEADDDNIIPVVDEGDYFADDITDRFVEFLRTTFGSEHLPRNIAFVEKALGKKLRKYFVKDFYKDHVKRYKKRPVYWLFTSPKGTFQALVYMHRYTPDTLNNLLNDYLRPFRVRLEAMRNEALRLTEREDISAREKTAAAQRIEKIDKTLVDIDDYEKVLAHYAAQRIEIDLDDGVKVNYCKFKEVLFEFDKKLCK